MFEQVLKEALELHNRKAKDYGGQGDPYANIRFSARLWGLQPWAAALIRLQDKIIRLAQFHKRGWLANEAAEDSLIDIVVYAIIALVLYRESQGLDSEPKSS